MTRQIKPKRRKKLAVQYIKVSETLVKFIKHTVSPVRSLPTIPQECSPKTLKRKQERDRRRLVWNSKFQGPYVRALHGEL